MTLTCGSQCLRLTVNVQIGFPRLILQEFIKLGDQIYELNYRGSNPELEINWETKNVILHFKKDILELESFLKS